MTLISTLLFVVPDLFIDDFGEDIVVDKLNDQYTVGAFFTIKVSGVFML